MTRLGALFLSVTAPSALRRFRHSCRRPAAVQHARLEDIVRANADTEFGRHHGFDRIRTFADFQRQVPVARYDDLEPYITAAMTGRPRQLTVDSPLLYTMTSGTTGPRKYIPMTAAERRVRRARSRLWVSALFHDHPRARAGQVLSMVSPEVESHAASGAACGSESGHVYRTMPRAVRSMYSTPYDVFTVDDYEARYYTVLRIAAGQDISCFVTANPSTVVLLAERLGRDTEAIVRDVRDGTLATARSLAPRVRASIRLAPDPARAARLERAAAANAGALRPVDAWPDLAVIGCWKGGSVGPYLSRFDRYFGSGTPVRDLGYLATETAGSVPLTDLGTGGVTAVDTDVLEFYPADLDHAPDGVDLLTVGQLEVGALYKVVVTTAAGLYRYDMNDIVRVDDRFAETPVISFIQKGDGIVSMTGEKLTESQVVAAVGHAYPPTLDTAAFLAAVVEFVDGVPHLVFLTEAAVLADDPGRGLLARLDDELERANSEYEAKRRSGRYGAPALRFVAAGELDRYRHRMVDAGRADGQFKLLRLTADAGFAREFAVTGEIMASELPGSVVRSG